ncbi:MULTISPECIES: hypothetical protein [unclassified Geodermatophilus]
MIEERDRDVVAEFRRLRRPLLALATPGGALAAGALVALSLRAGGLS